MTTKKNVINANLELGEVLYYKYFKSNYLLYKKGKTAKEIY